jgi:hypothetical protein
MGVLHGTAVLPIPLRSYAVDVAASSELVRLEIADDCRVLLCDPEQVLYAEDEGGSLWRFIAARDVLSLTRDELAPWEVSARDLRAGMKVLTIFGLSPLLSATRRRSTNETVAVRSGSLCRANGFICREGRS